MKRSWVVVLAAVLFAGPALKAATTTDVNRWMSKQAELSLRLLLGNISPAGTHKGVVVASPSKQDPDYWYHWVRDGALVMDVVVDLYRFSRTKNEKAFYFEKLKDFIIFSRKNQLTPTKGGIGEPKFNVDGSAFNHDWGRPQDDGPALRAIALTKLAFIWIAEGQKDMVRKVLYDSSNSLIKADLEYVAHRWRHTCFDLWEEVSGHHFYTRLSQRRSLIEGAKLAHAMGDTGAAQFYLQQARLLESEIHRHWDPSRGALVPTLDRDGGADYKHSGLDSSAILAVLHNNWGDGFYSPTNERVLSTFNKLEEVFQKIYVVNTKGYPAVAIGRYPEDRYTGTGSGEGNPWVLTTVGFGELLHEAAAEFVKKGRIDITSVNQAFFKALGVGVSGRQMITPRDPLFDKIIAAMKSRGDAYIARVGFHGHNGRFAEQINRYTGFMQGAPDLTWSYASFITAYWSRVTRR